MTSNVNSNDVKRVFQFQKLKWWLITDLNTLYKYTAFSQAQRAFEKPYFIKNN